MGAKVSLRLVKVKDVQAHVGFDVKRFASVIGGLAVLGAVSCGRMPSSRPLQPQVGSSLAGAADQVVASSRQGGNRAILVRLLPRTTAGFTSQSIVHRWVASDVTEYDLALSAGGQNLLTVQVLPQDGQNSAVLTNLRYSVNYTITVTAKGNDGGNAAAPIQVLNVQTPAVAMVAFTGDNDVNSEQSITVQVLLDSVTFDGSAAVSLTSSDGAYASPSEPESGFASSGSGSTPAPVSSSEPAPSPTSSPAPETTPGPVSSPFPTQVPSPTWTLPPGI